MIKSAIAILAITFQCIESTVVLNLQAFLSSMEEREKFGGKLIIRVKKDESGSLTTNYEVTMKQDSGLSDQTKLCISRRYYRVQIHEFGDLRGRE